MSEFEIDGRKIGPREPPFVIAELSANHNNDIDQAMAIIDAAATAGADAIKLQTYTADSLTIDCDREDFLIDSGLWEGQKLYELYKQASTPWDWHEALFQRAQAVGLVVFSSAFDPKAVDFLIELGIPAFKVASFELVDIPLIRHIAKTGRPMIMSTGMANPEEISEAVDAARESGCTQLALLHCISAYPTPIAEANLVTIKDLGDRFGVEVGLSDHTLGVTASIAAVSLGATIVEKHVTLKRDNGGPDAAFSLEPDELATLVSACRDAHSALGVLNYKRSDGELKSLRFRRSIYAVEDVPTGHQFDDSNVRSIRPGFGMHPRYLEVVKGRQATRDIKRGEPLDWSMVEDGEPN